MGSPAFACGDRGGVGPRRRLQLLPTTRLTVRQRGDGSAQVFFELRDVDEPSCWATLDLRPDVRAPVEDLEHFEDLERSVSLDEADGELDDVFETPWLHSLAADPRSSSLLLGGAGPWLLGCGSGGPAHFLRLLSHAAWEQRCEPFRGSVDFEPGIHRLRLEPGLTVACGEPNLLFARRGRGDFTEVRTGLAPDAALLDALPDGDAWFLVTRPGEMWRSERGRAERLVGPPAEAGFDPTRRLDVRRFGQRLAMTTGEGVVHFWEDGRLRSVPLPCADGRPGQAAYAGELDSLAVVSPTELWLAGSERVLVGDGTQWFELPNPVEPDLEYQGLCADPSGGVWLSAWSGRAERFFVVRATVARGLEPLALTPREEPLPHLRQPQWQRAGLVFNAGCDLLRWSPRAEGTALSLRLQTDGDDTREDSFLTLSTGRRRVDGPSRAAEAIDSLVATWGGWFEG
ncbi:MAG: hypothetical protein ACOZQL_28005 [Myxococcota bacterium]